MPVLPYNRVIDVSVVRNDNFPNIRGFGIPLLIQSTIVAGEVDATIRTKVYGTIDEVAVDFPTGAANDAATAAFSQNPRPLQIKIGYYDNTLIGTAQLYETDYFTFNASCLIPYAGIDLYQGVFRGRVAGTN